MLRPQSNLRARRSRMAGAGALLTMGSTAVVAAPLVTTAARAQTQPAITIADSTLRYGQTAEVDGGAGIEAAGRPVSLEFGSEGDGWRIIRSTTADAAGRYSFRVRPLRSGSLRVAVGGTAAQRSGAAAPAAPVTRSAAQAVVVSAELASPARRLDVLQGRAAGVRGVLRPGRAGRLVALERLRAGRWRTVARARTDATGVYRLRYLPRDRARPYMRVAFAGDALNAAAVRRIGRLNVYREALASRYDMYGGALACGGSLGYGSLVVAHKTLPCGTKVRIRYRGRSATATVRDRGPYAGGREFDLAGAVARRLGFDGVGVVWVST